MSNIDALRELMHTCVEIGFIRGQVAMVPSSDKIRKKDAEALLVRNGLSKVMLSRWVGEGLIHENKGERNSPIWYSLSELMEMIGAIRYKDCVV